HTNNWGDAGNWDTGSVPGKDDVVCIPHGNGTPILFAVATDPQIGSIRSDRPLQITSGALSVTSASDGSNIDSLTIDSTSGATFSIAGGLTTSSISVHGGAATFGKTVDGLQSITLDGGDVTLNGDTDVQQVDESGDSNLGGKGELSVKASYDWSGGTQGGGADDSGTDTTNTFTTNPFTTPPTTNIFTTLPTTNIFTTVTVPNPYVPCPPEIQGCEPTPKDGKTTIEAGAQLTIDSSDGVTLGRELSVDGTAYWNGGDLTLNAKMDVGGSFDLGSDGDLRGKGELSGDGEIHKSSSGDLTVEPKLTVDGTFEISDGNVTLKGGGGGGGSIELQSVDAGLTFDGGTYSFEDDSSFTGTAAFQGGGDGSPVEVKSGDVTFGGDFSVPHTTIDGGTATFKGGADVDKLELKGGVANFSSDGEDATIGELDQSGGTLGGTGKVSIT